MPEPEKKPRHVVVAINHILKQRTKAIAVRDKAAQEVQQLDDTLHILGHEGDDAK